MDNGLFALNQSTGVVTLATGKSLDYETSPSHTLVVQAAETTDQAPIQRLSPLMLAMSMNMPPKSRYWLMHLNQLMIRM